MFVYSAKSSKDIEELKTDSETYRRNLCIHLYQPFSSLKDWPWGWEERTGRKWKLGTTYSSSSVRCSVVSDSWWPHEPARLLCLWNCLGKNTGVGCHSLLQGIFPTQGSNPDLPYCRQTLYHLSHQGSPMSSNTNSYKSL